MERGEAAQVSQGTWMRKKMGPKDERKGKPNTQAGEEEGREALER